MELKRKIVKKLNKIFVIRRNSFETPGEEDNERKITVEMER